MDSGRSDPRRRENKEEEGLRDSFDNTHLGGTNI